MSAFENRNFTAGLTAIGAKQTSRCHAIITRVLICFGAPKPHGGQRPLVNRDIKSTGGSTPRPNAASTISRARLRAISRAHRAAETATTTAERAGARTGSTVTTSPNSVGSGVTPSSEQIVA